MPVVKMNFCCPDKAWYSAGHASPILESFRVNSSLPSDLAAAELLLLMSHAEAGSVGTVGRYSVTRSP